MSTLKDEKIHKAQALAQEQLKIATVGHDILYYKPNRAEPDLLRIDGYQHGKQIGVVEVNFNEEGPTHLTFPMAIDSLQTFCEVFHDVIDWAMTQPQLKEDRFLKKLWLFRETAYDAIDAHSKAKQSGELADKRVAQNKDKSVQDALLACQHVAPISISS